MTHEVIGLPRDRPLVRDDLDTMPDDGHRYELIDGLLIVSPAPRPVHQQASGNLYLALRAHCPADLQVLYAPLDVVLGEETVLQPDLLVARRSDFTDRELPTAPILAIEILSPSTRAYDLLLKKDRLQRAGCQHYWVVDSEVPAVTAWTLHGGSYVEVATVTGEQQLSVTEPFEISLTPSRLISD